ncbi:MAG: PBECR4 domain-containing protein [Roseburia sp.]|nr:PBECR4 domain-containing protein [Roseburia sp.]MCM1242242.1 PBECR4 domain-containing protein [Roseburia sp.]
MELLMDKIYECARNFRVLMELKYHIVVSKNRRAIELVLDFVETDFRHISGLHYIDDIEIENDPQKLISAILDEDITDTTLDKSQKYKSNILYEGGSIENRVSEMRYLENYLDADNFIRICQMQDFGSKIRADFFIESTLKDRGTTAYIFIRKREESDTYVIVSFFEKHQVYQGINLYWMLKEKISKTVTVELYRNKNFK